MKYQSLNAPNDKGFDAGTIEQPEEANVALEDLKRSNEAKQGSFMNKIAFWQKSNDAQLTAATEMKNVGLFIFIIF